MASPRGGVRLRPVHRSTRIEGAGGVRQKYPNQVVISTTESVRRDLPLHFFLEPYMVAYVVVMAAFNRVCTTEGASVPVGGDDDREALLLALAANKSFVENHPVKIDELR
ncbi:oxidoreductase [Phytophthora cinnamomi]|uniref:oxidoreductase n=1 Tax=Phytophthora cinnamomi TaxID=4785 RepID=UPI00355A4E6D|nr:oxidoreductase [Phytophthora cinnamomi]